MPASELEVYFSNSRLKDGLTRCNKLLKKSPNDPLLQLYRARFLQGLHHPDEATAILSALCERKPPIADATLITEIEELYYDCQLMTFPRPLKASPEAQKLWTNAINAASKRDASKLHMARLNHAIEQRRWEDARAVYSAITSRIDDTDFIQALVDMKKTGPPEMHTHTMHIAVMQILAETEPDHKSASLNKLLALRTADKYEPDSVDGLRLKLDVYLRQGKLNELLDMYTSGQSTIKPNLVHALSKEWRFVRLRIDVMTAAKQWDQLLHYCEGLLLDGSSHDCDVEVDGQVLKQMARNDWTVWTAYSRAAAAKQDHLDAKLIFSDMSGDNIRLVKLARFWLCKGHDDLAAQSPTADSQEPSSKLLEALTDYFNLFQDQPFCFNDLKEHVLGLSDHQAVEFRKHISEAPKALAQSDKILKDDKGLEKWLMAETNAVQLEYVLTIAKSANPDRHFVEQFVCNALRLLENCARHHAEVALLQMIILSASALVRLHDLDTNGPHLLQAACLLTVSATLKDPRGTVLLIYVLTELGLHLIAMDWYQCLNIKEVQHDTMSQMIISRLSVNHPFGFNTKESREWPCSDPFELTQRALSMYQVTDAKLVKSQEALIQNGRSDMLLELEEFRRTLAHSISRRILILEQRRIARLTDRPRGPDRITLKPAVMQTWTENLEDKRDFRASVHYGGEDQTETLEKRLCASGRIPGADWIRMQLLVDETWCLLQGPPPLCALDWGTYIDGKKEQAELTDMEASLQNIWQRVSAATASTILTLESIQAYPRWNVNTPDKATADLVAALESLPVQRVLEKESVPGHPPSAAALQDYFLLFDLLKALQAWTTIATEVVKNKRPGQKPPVQRVEQVRKLVKTHFDALQTHAKRQRSKIALNPTKQFLSQGPVGASVKKHLETTLAHLECDQWISMDWFADRVVSSATDAWDGVLKVKLGK